MDLNSAQQKTIIALIAGMSVKEYAESIGKREKAVSQELQRARDKNGLTTYQIVALVAADMARVEVGVPVPGPLPGKAA